MKAIAISLLAGVLFAAGFLSGERFTFRQLNTVCLTQPGASLHSTVQSEDEDGVLCIYSNEIQYGRTKRRIPAVKA